MPSDLTQLGALGIFAYLVIRELVTALAKLPALKRGTNGTNGSAGDKTVEFWLKANRDSMTEAMAVTLGPAMTRMADVLHELKEATNKEIELLTRLSYEHAEQKDRSERIYVGVKELREFAVVAKARADAERNQ